jgi:hypothetical protein
MFYLHKYKNISAFLYGICSICIMQVMQALGTRILYSMYMQLAV